MAKYVFTTFAHSALSPLKELLTEDRGINDLLQPHSIPQGYKLIREQFATPDNISRTFETYGTEIAVFHYSGHAGGDSVTVGDTDINIANHLEMSAKDGVLKLVFLNGCSTQGQVKRLLSAGVPAIIATHTKIDDKLASEFAIRFYKRLTYDGMSISQAFKEATTHIEGFTDRSFDGESRGVDYMGDNIVADEPIWGLFHRFPADTDINPLARGIAVPDNRSQFIVNKRLRETLFSVLLNAGNTEIIALDNQANNRIVEDSEIEKCIIDVLPMPVGEHLRKLFCYTDNPDGYEKLNRNRIEQICRVYCTTIELISYVLISQLWEFKTGNLPDKLTSKLHEHFYLTSSERQSFDYIPLIKEILAFLNQQPHITYFIKELSTFDKVLEPNTDFSTACASLNKLNIRRLIKDSSSPEYISSSEYVSLCESAEITLASFFEELGFLHQYHLTSIQAISILKYRYNKDPYYTHAVVPLMRADSSKSYYELHDCLSCQGVVLIKGDLQIRDRVRRILTAHDGLKFLNLTPFLIDINAFSNGNKSHVVSFDWYSKSTKEYAYKDISKPESSIDRIPITSDYLFEHLRAELNHYQTNILNTTFLP